MEKENCCGHRVKERSTAEYKDLINRLNRIEGQVRGIKKMVENNAYCPDILVQSAAVSAAMSSFNRELLSDHIRTCVVRDIQSGDADTVNESITELLKILQRLMK
ncbi:MAG TPA: metal-sensing transcriptional repressor [Candidatus Merdibacter merdavium]|uniref:Metal-sensing transcriptional repressor n=1 Tax=Candidatus Merdibacter merdavium TaxID=2838692 RepID=A0A9D2NR76_9FIRM|nr:metal-sensing transcriptional repressor [Candidatus Merdibacter merdavium]